MLARVWRFARVGHGVYEVAHGSKELAEHIEKQAKTIEEKQAELDEIYRKFKTLKDMVSAETKTHCPAGEKVCEMASDFIQSKVNASSSINTVSQERWEELRSGAEFVDEECRNRESVVRERGARIAMLKERIRAAKRNQFNLTIAPSLQQNRGTYMGQPLRWP